MSPKKLAWGQPRWERSPTNRVQPSFYRLSLHMLHPDPSAQALPAAFGDFLGGMDSIGNKSTFDTLPTILDLDVPAPYQLKDFPRQIHKGLWR